MRIRRAALDRMGETTLRSGAPMATIEEPLVPVFMFHRYVVESTASMIGGQDFVYAMRGDGRTPVRWESARNQKKAIGALVAMVLVAGLRFLGGAEGVTPALPLAWSDLLILSPCPLLAATVALVAARFTALARLKRGH